MFNKQPLIDYKTKKLYNIDNLLLIQLENMLSLEKLQLLETKISNIVYRDDFVLMELAVLSTGYFIDIYYRSIFNEKSGSLDKSDISNIVEKYNLSNFPPRGILVKFRTEEQMILAKVLLNA